MGEKQRSNSANQDCKFVISACTYQSAELSNCVLIAQYVLNVFNGLVHALTMKTMCTIKNYAQIAICAY